MYPYATMMYDYNPMVSSPGNTPCPQADGDGSQDVHQISSSILVDAMWNVIYPDCWFFWGWFIDHSFGVGIEIFM